MKKITDKGEKKKKRKKNKTAPAMLIHTNSLASAITTLSVNDQLRVRCSNYGGAILTTLDRLASTTLACVCN